MKNHFFKSGLRVGIILFLFVIHSVNVQGQPQYQVIDLGTLGGGWSIARGINDSGQVVGYSLNVDNYRRAFLWQNGNMTDLGTFGGGTSSSADAINNSGQVVGYARNADNNVRAFLWQNGNMTDLGTLGGNESIAYDISNSGQIVGEAADNDNHVIAFFWQNGNMINLGTLGGNDSKAPGVNDLGQCVGRAEDIDGNIRAFFWQNGNMTDLGTFGGNNSEANDINNSGQVVGSAESIDNLDKAFLWQNGNMTNLGTLGGNYSYAYGINDSGSVVGNSFNFNNLRRPFLWKNGNMIDLNDLIDPNSGWVLGDAISINNLGQIVGSGDHNGEHRAFLLIPGSGIINPTQYIKWIAGETDTIKWLETGWIAQNIKCILNVGTPEEQTYSIEEGTFFDTSYYVWEIPDTLLSYRTKIVIENSANPSEKIESDIFRIKPYLLTRVKDDSTYYAYKKNRDQWGFSNTQADMWPSTWFNQFDYRGEDPFTESQYSQSQGDSVFANSNSANHSDWVSFVNAFGTDACYRSTFWGTYSSTALTAWKSRKGSWGGSCFGIAGANALAFSFKDQFQNTFTNFPNFSNPISVTSNNGVKKVVNEIFSHQYGNPSIANDGVSFNIKTPNQTINELKQILMEDNCEARSITIYNNSGRGAHTILPFGLKQESSQNNLYYILIYDNSNPNSNNPITVDTTQNSGTGVWSTPDWTGWGGNFNLYLELTADTYLNPAALTKAGEFKSPFIKGDGVLEINKPSGSSIKIIDSQGNVTGYSGNNFFTEIPGSIPRFIKNGSEAPPYGYSLITDNYSVILNELEEDTVKAFFFTGNKSFSYERYSAEQNQTDRLFFDGGVSVSNPDAETKSVKLLNIINETTREKVFALRSIELAQNDSVKIENPDSSKIKLISYGTAKEYDIELNFATENSFGRFGDFNVHLTANTSHTLVPDWEEITNTELQILIDVGNDGTIDDTLNLNNTVDVDDQGSVLSPNSFNLAQNYPNPFNPTTTIQYSIPQSSRVTLKVYDILGNEVVKLVNEEKETGVYSVTFNASGLSSGIYFYRIQAGSFIETKQMILIK